MPFCDYTKAQAWKHELIEWPLLCISITTYVVNLSVRNVRNVPQAAVIKP